MKRRFIETTKQPYANYTLSAGVIENDPIERIYLKFKPNKLGKQQGRKKVTLILQTHEAAAICYCLAGALWSHELGETRKNDR